MPDLIENCRLTEHQGTSTSTSQHNTWMVTGLLLVQYCMRFFDVILWILRISFDPGINIQHVQYNCNEQVGKKHAASSRREGHYEKILIVLVRTHLLMLYYVVLLVQ